MSDATSITIRDQIIEAQLHARGHHDFVDRFGGTKKRPQYEVDRARERAAVADAIVRTLREVALARGGAA